MTIIMTGIAEFQRAIEAMVERATAATKQAVTTGGHLLEAEAKRQLGMYSHPSGTPTPSPRGEPPAIVTGTLRRSIRVTSPEPTGTAGWSISVGPTAIYGRIQELGGDTGRGGATYLPPRPYMDPALKKVLDDGTLASCYTAAWRGALMF